MKNLAGNDVSIFLYRFVLRKNAISFVLNESIAEDMYTDIENQLQPLIKACSETLLNYRQHAVGDTIMDGNILNDGGLEVMLESGLGSYFLETHKQNLFDDAITIAESLLEVMGKRTQEINSGTYPGPQTVINKIQRLRD